MESSKLNMDELIPFDKLDHALEDKIKLQSLEDEEAYLEHLKAIFVQLGYWEEIDKLQKQMRNIWGKIYELKREMWCSYGKRTFQQNLQKEYGDSKLVIVHEYDPYVKPPWVRVEIIPKHVEEQTSLAPSHDDISESKNEVVIEASCEEIAETLEEMVETPSIENVGELEEVVEASCEEMIDEYKGDVETPCGEIGDDLESMVEEQTSLALSHDDIQEPNDGIASKQEELDLYSNVAPIYDEYPESDCEEFVETFEEMVEAPCEEIVETREEVVEIPCMESHEDFEEVVETVGMENVGSTMECFEKVDSHPRLEVGLQGEQTRKHEFAKVYFVEYVHDSTFVEFNPTKIRGRIFSKKGRMIQVHGVMGNTSKLIFLVSLFNIWVWLIMQVRTRAFMLTCVITRNSPANGNRTVCVYSPAGPSAYVLISGHLRCTNEYL